MPFGTASGVFVHFNIMMLTRFLCPVSSEYHKMSLNITTKLKKKFFALFSN